jgi:hypothetical protein
MSDLMSDLILRTRLDMLNSNLENVQAVDSVEDVRAGLQQLLDLPTDRRIQSLLVSIIEQVNNSKTALWRLDPGVGGVEEIEESLNTIAQQATNIRDYLRTAGEAAHTIKSRSLQIRGGEVWAALQEGLVDNADRQIEAVGEIQALLRSAAEASARNDQDAALGQLRKAWQRYSNQTYPKSQRILTEYLDFLGGLAMRDTGYDQGICRLADELIRSCGRLPGGFTWSSLTIPTRQEALTETVARLIRLGFPEWTIWALPLTAHEFGHVVVERHEPIRNLIEQSRLDDQGHHEMRMCLADAFATYVMGPAYACALILIRLDPLPSSVDEGGRLADRRARAVLGMLRRMNDKAPASEKPYAKIIERLETAWEAALAQGGMASVLSQQELAESDRWVELLASSMGTSQALPVAAWPRIKSWWEKLRLGDLDGIQVSISDELRYVLNASWMCRMEVDDPTRNKRIAEAARQLWEMIQSKQRPEPAAPGRRPAPPSTVAIRGVGGSSKPVASAIDQEGQPWR